MSAPATHQEASARLHAIKDKAFARIKASLLAGTPLTEKGLQASILEDMRLHGLTTDGDEPIVAVNEHAATPHYFPSNNHDATIRRGDLILLDLWARTPGGVYADITWMAYAGPVVPTVHAERFALIVKAREAAIAHLRKELAKGMFPRGAEVDAVARSIIAEAGYGDRFIHNLGHSIDTSVHGTDVNLRGYTEHERRRVHERLLFSIEPGIYLPEEAGYRTEIDAYIEDDGQVTVTGPAQDEITPLLDSNI